MSITFEAVPRNKKMLMYDYSYESYCKHFHIVSNKKLKKHTKGLRVSLSVIMFGHKISTTYQLLTNNSCHSACCSHVIKHDVLLKTKNQIKWFLSS